MTIPVRSAMVLLAVTVLNLGTLHSWGFYTTAAFLAVIAALVLGVLAACIGRLRQVPALLLPVFAVGMAVIAVGSTDLMYGDSVPLQRLQAAVTLAALGVIATGLLATIPLLGLAAPHRPTELRWMAAFILMGGLLVRMLVLVTSPDPVVDVFSLLRDGADHIVAGANPYTHDIDSPYGTPRAAHFGIEEPPDARPAGYPPLPLLAAALPRLLRADVRWANIAADLIAAAAMIALGWRRDWRWAGVLAAGVYLNLPRAPFIIEQAWYEPMIAALLGLGLVLSEFQGERKTFGYVLLGLGLTAKQFGLPLLFPLAIAHRRHWPLILLGLIVGGLVMLPFFLASPRDFMDIVLFKHLGRPLQPQSITVGSFLLNEFGTTLPRITGWGLAAAAVLGIAAITPRDSAATSLGLGTALLAFCVFHTQGFPNYFHLVQYLWLLGFVGMMPRSAPLE